jgi:hypothetical protein
MIIPRQSKMMALAVCGATARITAARAATTS